MIHLQTEVRGIGGGGYLENFGQTVIDVIWQLPRRFILPAVGDFFQIKRRKFALDTVSKGEVKLRRLAGLTMTQESSRFAGIVIAVVEEENNLAANFTLEPKRGLDFCNKENASEKIRRVAGQNK